MQSLNDLKDVDSMQQEILVRTDEATEDGAGPATYEEALRLAVTEEMPASGEDNSQRVPADQDSPGDLNARVRCYFDLVSRASPSGVEKREYRAHDACNR